MIDIIDIAESLEKNGITIQPGKLIRLIKLLELLWNDGFNSLSMISKRQLLGNLLDINKSSDQKNINKVATLVAKEMNIPSEGNKIINSSIAEILSKILLTERQENIKGLILNYLLHEEKKILKWFSLEDIIFSIFLDDSLTRHKMYNFMKRYFSTDNLIASIQNYIKNNAPVLKKGVINMLLSIDQENLHVDDKMKLLSVINKAADKEEGDMQKIFMEYIKYFNRFDLIRVFDVESDLHSMWMKSPEERNPQLTIKFKKPKSIDYHYTAFNKRIQAIKEL